MSSSRNSNRAPFRDRAYASKAEMSNDWRKRSRSPPRPMDTFDQPGSYDYGRGKYTAQSSYADVAAAAQSNSYKVPTRDFRSYAERTQSRVTRIGLYMDSFEPVTSYQVSLGKQALVQDLVDRVIFIPTVFKWHDDIANESRRQYDYAFSLPIHLRYKILQTCLESADPNLQCHSIMKSHTALSAYPQNDFFLTLSNCTTFSPFGITVKDNVDTEWKKILDEMQRQWVHDQGNEKAIFYIILSECAYRARISSNWEGENILLHTSDRFHAIVTATSSHDDFTTVFMKPSCVSLLYPPHSEDEMILRRSTMRRTSNIVHTWWWMEEIQEVQQRVQKKAPDDTSGSDDEEDEIKLARETINNEIYTSHLFDTYGPSVKEELARTMNLKLSLRECTDSLFVVWIVHPETNSGNSVSAKSMATELTSFLETYKHFTPFFVSKMSDDYKHFVPIEDQNTYIIDSVKYYLKTEKSKTRVVVCSSWTAEIEYFERHVSPVNLLVVLSNEKEKKIDNMPAWFTKELKENSMAWTIKNNFRERLYFHETHENKGPSNEDVIRKKIYPKIDEKLRAHENPEVYDTFSSIDETTDRRRNRPDMSEFINTAVEERSLREIRVAHHKKMNIEQQEREIHMHSAVKRVNNVRNLIRNVVAQYLVWQVANRWIWSFRLEKLEKSATVQDKKQRRTRHNSQEKIEILGKEPVIFAVLDYQCKDGSDQMHYFQASQLRDMKVVYCAADFSFVEVQHAIQHMKEMKHFSKHYLNVVAVRYLHGNLCFQRVGPCLRLSDPNAISYCQVDDNEPKNDEGSSDDDSIVDEEDMEHPLLAAKHNFEEGSTLWVQIVNIQNEINKIFFCPAAAHGFIGAAVERLCLGGFFCLVSVNSCAIARLAYEALRSDVCRLDKKYFSIFFPGSTEIWRSLFFGDRDLYQKACQEFPEKAQQNGPIDASQPYRIRYKMEIDIFPQNELAHTPLGLSLKNGLVRLSSDDAEYDFMVPNTTLREFMTDVGLTVLSEIPYEAIVQSLRKATEWDRRFCSQRGMQWQDREKDTSWSKEYVVDWLVDALPQVVGSGDILEFAESITTDSSLDYEIYDDDEREVLGLYTCYIAERRALATSFCLNFRKSVAHLKKRISKLEESEGNIAPESALQSTGFVKKLNIHENEIELLTKKRLRKLKAQPFTNYIGTD